MCRKESYDKVASTYDQGRPSYPEEVIDWIVGVTKLRDTDRLLEIAPGTGQATIEFARRGYSIKCVELGKNLAEILVDKTIGMDVSVDVSSFEAWNNISKTEYDLIYCATAFHWLDPSVKFEKCYDLLTNDGKLVLIWNVSSESDNPIIKKAYDLLWSYCPSKKHINSEKLKELRKLEIEDSSNFSLVDYLNFDWNPSQMKEQFVQGFFSQSSYLSLPESKKLDLDRKLISLFENLDQVIYSDISTTVYICEKK